MRRGDGANTCATALQVSDALQVNVRAAGGGGLREQSEGKLHPHMLQQVPTWAQTEETFTILLGFFKITLDSLHSAWTGPTSVFKRV